MSSASRKHLREKQAITRLPLLPSDLPPPPLMSPGIVLRSGRTLRTALVAQHANYVALDHPDALEDIEPEWLTTTEAFTDAELGPKTRKTALKSKFRHQWLAAEQEEINSLQEFKTFTPVVPPEGANIVGSKWVYKAKLKTVKTATSVNNMKQSIERFRARLVALGYSQAYGVDYFETYAPVVRAATLRWLIALSVIHGWTRRQADVCTAFLNPLLHEDIYLRLPPGYEHEYPGMVLKLNKGLYGLKQASRLWYQRLRDFFTSKGFTQSTADPCVFYRAYGPTNLVYLSVYVDDITFFGHDDAIEQALATLQHEFKLRDLGDLDSILGIQVHSTADGVLIHQTNYIQTILKRFSDYLGFPTSTPLLTTPLSPRLNVSDVGFDPILDSPFDTRLYLQAIGSLNYASTYTRIDITTAVSFLSQFNTAPAVKHWNALMKVFNYLQSCPDLGIFYSRHGNSSLIGYPDASFNIHYNSRSQLGYLITLANGPIHWKSSKTKVTCLSSTEAEYMSISDLGRELQSFANLYEALSLPLLKPILIYEDNLGTIAMCTNDSYTARSKHIAVRYHHVRDLVNSGLVKINHISTHDQPADLLTKGLHKSQFLKLRHLLNLKLWTTLQNGSNAMDCSE
jgi:Reverse transcriptase (RNA-dependent DNA polymerase)